MKSNVTPCTVSLEMAKTIAQTYLLGGRLRHSIGVSQLAAHFASQLNCDSHRAALAGMVHDICKPFDLEQLKATLEGSDGYVTEDNHNSTALLHGPAAAYLLSVEYGWSDQSILRAIQYHTTGTAHLDQLGLLLYAADFLDPCRAFDGQKNVWEAMALSLREGLLAILNFSISHLLQRQQMIHPDSILFYNWLISNKNTPNLQTPLFC